MHESGLRCAHMWEEEDVEVRMCGEREREGEIGGDWMGGVGVEEQGAHVGCERTEWVGAVHQCMPQDRVDMRGMHGAQSWVHMWAVKQDLQPNLSSLFSMYNCMHKMDYILCFRPLRAMNIRGIDGFQSQ